MSRPTEPPRESIPLRSALARMSIQPGTCLAHVDRLHKLEDESGYFPYVVCMGPPRTGLEPMTERLTPKRKMARCQYFVVQ